MDIGIVLPQGWLGEYHGWDHGRAWTRTLAIAREAERLGFESVWAYDHFTPVNAPAEEPTFEAFAALTAVAAATTRVRLGPLVAGVGYRNPALLAKMTGTLDVIAGGRFEIGVGAGWKRDEYQAFGYPFPPVRDRMALLRDTLEILVLMLGADSGRGSYEGTRASVRRPWNAPRGAQEPWVPIVVGGNGPEVTWRLAARYADEINLDGLDVEDVQAAMPVIAARCEEIGRDPATLRVSAHLPWRVAPGGPDRAAWLAEFAVLGVVRAQFFVPDAVNSDEALAAFAEDVRTAGLPLAPMPA
ncbi:MAG: LLM class flavin-dependent oxidoreductase [Chloroflexi bacterium]|nr:LLM class flavin-dependent oxidoreductase [Chloroflexota bacterium]